MGGGRALVNRSSRPIYGTGGRAFSTGGGVGRLAFFAGPDKTSLNADCITGIQQL